MERERGLSIHFTIEGNKEEPVLMTLILLESLIDETFLQ